MAKVRRYYFEEGSAVRVSEDPLPSREERARRERERRKQERRAKERRKREAMHRSRRSALGLCGMTALICGFLVGYVYLQAETQTSMRHIAALEDEITTLKADNAAEQNRISAEMNLKDVRDAAAGLGMVYADNGQIVYYTVGDSDYMTQYDDITDQ